MAAPEFIKPSHPEFALTLKRAQDRCEGHPTITRDGKPIRCKSTATEVVREGAVYHAFCFACRLAGCGTTPAERTAARKAFAERQEGLFEAALTATTGKHRQRDARDRT